jgi:hypothetical protein
LRNLHTVLHNGCTDLHSHQQCMSSPFSISLPAFLFVCFCFFYNIHSNIVFLIVVFICISMIVSDVEYFFIYLLSFVFLLRNVYLDHLPIFKLNFLIFLVAYLLFPLQCRNFSLI